MVSAGGRVALESTVEQTEDQNDSFQNVPFHMSRAIAMNRWRRPAALKIPVHHFTVARPSVPREGEDNALDSRSAVACSGASHADRGGAHLR
jgi:hypothetical protein